MQQPQDTDSFYGFNEQDLNDFPQKIPLPLPIFDIQLAPDLHIRTTTPAEAIKKIIVPKKVAKSTDIPDQSPEKKNSTRKRKQQGNGQRFSPYPENVYTSIRRSERVASKRSKRCSSFI